MTTGRPIDHVVIAVDDLEAAARRYESLGFTLTPRASHPDHMGTANRLAQFTGGNFIELVEADRPDRMVDHDLASTPPRFSFGAHIRAFTERQNGMAALVLASDDARAEAARLAAAGIQTYAPIDFERTATQPDGTTARVAFSLAFATSPDLPDLAFYFCQHHTPETFWKPRFQSHANTAQAITAVHLSAEDPSRHRGFLEHLTGATGEPVPGGWRFRCGSDHDLLLRAPEQHAGGASADPRFVGVTIQTARAPAPAEACGVTVEWQDG